MTIRLIDCKKLDADVDVDFNGDADDDVWDKAERAEVGGRGGAAWKPMKSIHKYPRRCYYYPQNKSRMASPQCALDPTAKSNWFIARDPITHWVRSYLQTLRAIHSPSTSHHSVSIAVYSLQYFDLIHFSLLLYNYIFLPIVLTCYTFTSIHLFRLRTFPISNFLFI